MNLFGNYLSSSDLWLLAAAAGCLAWLVHHWLALARDRRNAIRKPVADFKANFAAEIAAFREDETTFLTLSDAFLKHRAAVDTIMPLLAKKDRARLQRAWDKYCSIANGFDAEKKSVAIAGYGHPDMRTIGKKRFAAVHSCLDHLA